MSGTTAPTDTIIALASGAGRAGVAVIRVSGPGTLGVLAHLTDGRTPLARVASLRKLRDQDGALIDEALVLYMPAPNSYTGEDIVEFHVHGGPAIVAAVLKAAVDSRICRHALPGEFTRRAFDAGRMDLTQAEAVADLIDAETEGQRRQAARLYSGEAARIFENWRGQLVLAMAALEAGIDFPDEADVPAEVAAKAVAPLQRLAHELTYALEDSSRLNAIREGFRIAILGPPNAGKSSLMNRLAKREAAIVSPIPGTTRDVVEIRTVMAGFPVWIADTAGLRETSDVIEAEGVRRALERAEDADLRIWVEDVSRETSSPTSPVETPASRSPQDESRIHRPDPEEAQRAVSKDGPHSHQSVSRETPATGSAAGQPNEQRLRAQNVSRETSLRPGDIVALNKVDLAAKPMRHESGVPVETFITSMTTGKGVDVLERRLTEIVRQRLEADEPPLITRERHRALVEDALSHVERALEAARIGIGAEMVSEDLRLAARALGRVTGTVDVEDLLDRIFSDFCIGK